jgi:hypothetical protein
LECKNGRLIHVPVEQDSKVAHFPTASNGAQLAESWLEDPMADINWLRRYDQGVEQATQVNKPILIDFTAAPM